MRLAGEVVSGEVASGEVVSGEVVSGEVVSGCDNDSSVGETHQGLSRTDWS